MTNRLRKKLGVLMLSCLAFAMYSCEETDYDTTEFNSKKTISQISTDNFLNFDSFEDLEQKVKELSNMTYEEQIIDEESNNFVSIDRIYEEISLAEEELLKPYEHLTVEELSKMPRITSATHDMYSDILITDTLEDGGLIELPNANPNYTKVLNRKSIVKVAGKIYQFKRNVTKIIEDGDASKIACLDRINVSDSTLKIKVCERYTDRDVVRTAYKTNGTFKVELKNRFVQVRQSEDLYVTAFLTEINVMKKAFWLYYIRHRGEVNHTWAFNGNTVVGYREKGDGYRVIETHSWNRNQTKTKKHYEIQYGHEAGAYTNIIEPNKYIHYNNYNNLPILSGGVQNHIRVRCNNNKTIEFYMNY